MYNKHVDAQKTVTLSFREKEKGANLIRFAPFMRRDRVMNLSLVSPYKSMFYISSFFQL